MVRYHFVESGGPIPAAHTAILREHFSGAGRPVVVHGDEFDPRTIDDEDVVVSADMATDAALEPERDRLFEVQLAHNLTGLKGSPFCDSRAHLNVLPGRQIRDHYRIDPDDPRFVVGGYPKWDLVHPERFRREQRRKELGASLGLDAGRPWVVFYPTGPNEAYRTTCGRAVGIYLRLRRDLGEIEFVLCNHAHNRADPTARAAVDDVRALSRRDRHVRIIEGHETLPLLAGCDLFITDVASTLITAISLDRPVLFVTIETIERCRAATQALQCGERLDEISDVREWLARYRTPDSLRALLARAVAFDDAQNRARVARLVVERHDEWRRRRVR